jgi:hypothetical protein
MSSSIYMSIRHVRCCLRSIYRVPRKGGENIERFNGSAMCSMRMIFWTTLILVLFLKILHKKTRIRFFYKSLKHCCIICGNYSSYFIVL